ncbi:MAG: tetratricopeptide repeat protein [Oligoflexia bacterium]|nr:tetratricopeptide repeat protein [Oligoflexia bacterium]
MRSMFMCKQINISLINRIGTMLILLPLLSSCDYMHSIEAKSRVINNYEQAAAVLAKENRELKMIISKLEYDLQALRARNSYLELKLKDNESGGVAKKKGSGTRDREKASAELGTHKDENVDFGVYRWKAEQLLTMAESAFKENNYQQAIQYFSVLLKEYPEYKDVDDLVLFEAGVSAYKSGKFYDLAVNYLSSLISKYPSSKYYRGAKLWLALSQYQKGNTEFLFKSMEEFRKKYRNTSEWKILSAYYENIRNTYKR